MFFYNKIRRWREPPIQSFPCRTGHRPDLFAAAGNCVAKKILLTFRMPHGFDFATQNLGAREEFLHLIRKPPPLRKTVGFPKTCGNFSTKSRPTTPKVKVVRPEQIRLLLERTSSFAGGGSQPFNHFHAELATGQICSRLLETALQKKRCVLLGCHTDSILLRKIWEQGRNSHTWHAKQLLHPRKTAVLPKSCCIFSGFQRKELVPVRVAEGAMEKQYIYIEEKININKK